MNNRLKTIFLFLLQNNDNYISVKELSDKFQISIRTMYSDLSQLDNFLIEHGFLRLSRIKNKGICLNTDELQKKKLQELIHSDEIRDYSPHQRRYRILRYLLESTDYITIDEISNYLKYSRNTIVNDLKGVKLWLKAYDLNLLTFPWRGICIGGEEQAIRNAWTFCIVGEGRELKFQSKLFLGNLLEIEEIEKLKQMVTLLEQRIGTMLSDESYHRLILYLGFSIFRIRKNKNIEGINSQAQVFESNEYQAVIGLKQVMENNFHLKISEQEILSLTLQLIGGSLQNPDKFKNVIDQWLPLQLMVRKFIEAMEKDLGICCIPDDKLFYSLLVHLRPAYYRILGGVPMLNPMYEYVKENFTLIHQRVMDNIFILEENLQITFTEDEASFISLCFAAAVERQKKKNQRQPVTMVVCGTGTSTSQILLSQLQNEFDIQILGTFSARSVNEILKTQHVDLIISTVELSRNDVEVIQVNTVLTQNDIQRLKKVLKTLDTSIDVNVIIEIMRKHGTIQNEWELKKELEHYLKNNEKSPKRKERDPMLIEVLNEDLIRTNVEITTRDEAVSASGELLYQNGFAEKEYIDAMLENVRKNGNYIVIAPGIAMPHARPECGAKKIGFSLMTLKEPVKFGHRTNDPVKIVIGLCAIDHQTHLTALSELVEILNDQDKMQAILDSDTSVDIMNIIKEGK